MPYVLGVDVGNTSTAAAAARISENGHNSAPHPVRLGHDSSTVPTVVFVAEDGLLLVGEPAERAGSGRPDRLVRDFRQRVGDTVPIAVGELRIAAEDILATVVRWTVDRAADIEGEPPDAICVTYPASWGEYRLGVVRRALAGVGLADVPLLSEPEAAALNHAEQQSDGIDGTVAVYDLGGSGFTGSLVKLKTSSDREILGQPCHIERLGGADFDDLVFRRLSERMGGRFPPESSDVRVAGGVGTIRRACIEAKESLSFRTEASVRVDTPGVRAEVRLARHELEGMIDGHIRETIDALWHAIDSAGLTAGNLTSVLLVGGTAQIPLVGRMLDEEFDCTIVVDPDPVNACARGAAHAAVAGTLAHALLEDHAQAQGASDTDGAQAPTATERHPVASPLVRFGRGAGAARLVAKVVPVAVAAAVAALIATVVVAQGTGFSSLTPRETAENGADGWFLPESLRADGNPGFPFRAGFGDQQSGAEAAPFLELPPAGNIERDEGSDRQKSGVTRADQEKPTAPRPAAQQVGKTTPKQPLEIPSDPNPPAVQTDPVPDPEPAPAPDPEPVRDPDPAPATDPVPVPDPEPEPDPAPIPEPEAPVEPPADTGV